MCALAPDLGMTLGQPYTQTFNQGNAEVVRQSAHALKSSSQNVGACALATLSQKLEEMGRSGELVDTEKYMGELDKLYPKTVLALKAVIQQVGDAST